MKKLTVVQIADATNLAATTTYSYTADWNKAEAIQFVYASTTANFSISIQHSLDNANWSTEGTATTVTNTSGNVLEHLFNKDALYWRVNVTRTNGTLTTFAAYVATSPR